MRRQVWISAALLALVFIAANRLSFEHLRWRTDLSEDGLREWAPVTDAILERLEDPLQIELFFPEQTQLGWVQIAKRTNLELLTELADRSDTPIELLRSDTGRADVANRAQGYGIPTTTESGLSGTSAVVERITLGAVLRYRGRERVLPRLLPGALEYTVLDAIYGLTRPSRPKVGILETPISEGITRTLAMLDRYDLEPVSGLEQGLRMPADLDLLVAPGPIDVGPQTRAALEAHVAQGGRLLVYADRTRSNLESYDLVRRDSGLEGLLESWGLPLSPKIVWDRATGTPIGNRSNNSLIAYPAWPSVLRGADPEDDAERFADENPIGASLLGLHARFAHEVLPAEGPAGGERVDLLSTSGDALDFAPTGKMIADAEGIALEHDRLLVTADPARRALIAAVRGPLGGPEA
ncbi:MAG: Gldg family protein, partial [Planctomycetota bacterium]